MILTKGAGYQERRRKKAATAPATRVLASDYTGSVPGTRDFTVNLNTLRTLKPRSACPMLTTAAATR